MAGASLFHHVIVDLWLIGVDLWLDCCLLMAGSSLTYLDSCSFMAGVPFIYGWNVVYLWLDQR